MKVVGRAGARLSDEELEGRDEGDVEPEAPDPDGPYVRASIDNPFVTT